jgi:hypothetical protein
MQSTPEKRELALLRAVGLDKAAPEQRELALAIADRYGLDLMLKHLVLIEGRPYLTRDALLHIAHRSGQLDGIEATEPVLSDGFWRASCTVWRKDMSRGFTYSGRYPEKGGNAKFAPEMALKVAESMALRRAFDIGAPSADERWDADAAAPSVAVPPAPTLAEVARTRAEAVQPEPVEAASEAMFVEVAPEPTPAPAEAPGASTAPVAARCNAASPYESGSETCAREAGHPGNHKNHQRESWA